MRTLDGIADINDIVYWTRGDMTWKFGADLDEARLNVIPSFAASGGRWSFRVLNTSNNRSTNLGNGGNPYATSRNCSSPRASPCDASSSSACRNCRTCSPVSTTVAARSPL
jgi:hypothetical protein